MARGCSLGPWGHCQGNGQGREGAAKTMELRPRGVGHSQVRGQDHGGAARGRGGAA